MRRLVVAGVLPRDGATILRIVHQGVDAIRRGRGGGVDAEVQIVGRAPDDFLAPVTENVSTQVRRGLGAVVGGEAGGREDGTVDTAGPVPFVDRRAVEGFAQHVGIPPDAEIFLRRMRAGNLHAGRAHQSAARAPHFVAAVARVNVVRHAAAHVRALAVHAENQRAGFGVAVFKSVRTIRTGVFVNHPDFLAGPPRIHVGKMFGVTMAEAGGVKSVTVAVNRSRAIDNVIAAVGVGVADGKAVRALAFVVEVGRVAVERPAAGERVGAPVPGGDVGAGVIAATKNSARPLTVEKRDAREEAIQPVAIAVAPDSADACGGRIVVVVVGVALGIKRRGCKFFAGETVEHAEKFWAGEDVAVHAVGAGRAIIIGVVEGRMRPVGGLPFREAADVIAQTILRARAGAAHDLGFAVAVEIVNHEVHVMRAGTDIGAEINAPEPRAVQFVAVQIRVTGEAALRIVLRVGGIPFDDDFVFTVAVHVADAAIIGVVSVRAAGIGAVSGGGFGAAGRRRERDVEILLRGRAGNKRVGHAHRLRNTADDGFDEIGIGDGEVRRRVHVVRGVGEQRGVQLVRDAGRDAVKVEAGVVRVVAEQTPADINLRGARPHGDHAAPEIFQLALGVGG